MYHKKMSNVKHCLILLACLLIVWAIFILSVYGALKLWDNKNRPTKAEAVTTEEANRIISELHQRSAENCECTPVNSDWYCREIASGKLFIIRKVTKDESTGKMGRD